MDFLSEVVVLYCYKSKTKELAPYKQEYDHQWHQRPTGIQSAEIPEIDYITSD